MTHPIAWPIPVRHDHDGIEWPAVQHPGHAWHARALCKGENPARWDYPDSPTMRGKRLRAAEACHGCPVVQACATAALAEHSREIVRAGVPIPGYSGDIRAAIRQLEIRAGIHQQQAEEAA